MALIADIVESAVRALAGVGAAFRWNPLNFSDDIGSLAVIFKEKAEEFAAEHPSLTAAGAFSSLPTLITFTALGLGDPKTFTAELLRKYSAVLQDAFGLLNVELPPVVPGAQETLPAQIAMNLEQGRIGSQQRVTAAISLINFIIGSSSAITVAVELFSLGQMDTLADAIQSWVWANGLGSFTPLAFSPQVNASIAPYLTRFYNSKAQAQIPPVTDIIRFQLREVFLAGRREELVGTEERPIFNALMKEWGFSEFHADSYWGAHWGLPSQGQLNEMLHRGVIDRDTWERFTRFNDVEPTTIPWLAEIIYNPFTRVDVRRMSRFGILSDDELLQAYADLGFFAPTERRADGSIRAVMVPNPDFTIHKAQAQVVFTKVFNAIPLLRQRFSKGHIDGDEVLAGLMESGVGEMKAQILFQTIVKEVGPERVAPERNLTRGLIARAWKLRFISFAQAVFLLTRMGWGRAEAELILRVQSERDDPVTFAATQLGADLIGPLSAEAMILAAELEGE